MHIKHHSVVLTSACGAFRTEKHGEGSLECANLYFLYGKALLENAVSQSAVLGKDDPDAAQNEDEADNGMSVSHDSQISASLIIVLCRSRCGRR